MFNNTSNYSTTEALYGLPSEWAGLMRFIMNAGPRNIGAFEAIRKPTPPSDDFRTFRDNTFIFYLARSTSEPAITLVNRIYLKFQDFLLALKRLDHVSMVVAREAEDLEWKAKAATKIEDMRVRGWALFQIIQVGEPKPFVFPPIVNAVNPGSEVIRSIHSGGWDGHTGPIVPTTVAVHKGPFSEGVFNKLLEVIGPDAETFLKDDVFRAYRMFRGGNVRVGKHARHRILHGFLSTWSKTCRIRKLEKGSYQILNRVPSPGHISVGPNRGDEITGYDPDVQDVSNDEITGFDPYDYPQWD